MDRRRFLTAGLAGLTLAGCEFFKSGDSGSPSPTGPSPVDEGLPPVDPGSRKAPSPIGYSNVATLNAAEARQIVGAGLTLVQAEAVPFGHDWESSYDIQRLKDIVAVTRQFNAVFFIAVVNANGKVQMRMHEKDTVADQFFTDRIREIQDEVGTDRVWLEGVSEPWANDEVPGLSARTKRWQQIALREWSGVSVQNGDQVSAQIRDVHHCRYDALLNGVKRGGGTLNSTDCTPVLASRLSEKQIREVTRAAVRSRARLIMYDTSNAPAANMNVVRWMSEELPNG